MTSSQIAAKERNRDVRESSRWEHYDTTTTGNGGSGGSAFALFLVIAGLAGLAWLFTH